MKQTFIQFKEDFETLCEVVYCDENDEILDEAAIRAFKRSEKTIKRYYRCTTGAKAGRLVSDPKKCAVRKDPVKVRHGRKVMRKKKGIIQQKSKITKRSAISKLITKKNVSLSKNTGSKNTNQKSNFNKSSFMTLIKNKKPAKTK